LILFNYMNHDSIYSTNKSDPEPEAGAETSFRLRLKVLAPEPQH
jgi:hypothetical protein